MLILIVKMLACVLAAYPLACVALPLFVLPFYDSAYLVKAIMTFGIAPLSYSFELATTFGSLELCGFLSGNCTRHHFRGSLIVTWVVLALCLGAGARWYRKSSRRDSTQE